MFRCINLFRQVSRKTTATRSLTTLTRKPWRAATHGLPLKNTTGVACLGVAQMNQAGIDAAANLSDGIAKAYAQDQGNAVYNSNAQLQGQQQQEAAAQQFGNFNSQQAYANQMNQIQNQQALAGMLTGMFGSPRPAADPAQQMAAMRSADNSRSLLGALLS